MRVKNKSIKKFNFLLKKSAFLLVSFFIFSIVSLYAQNGIPIDVLQSDPYFRSGSTDNAVETEETSTQSADEEENENLKSEQTDSAKTSTETSSEVAAQNNTADTTPAEAADESSETKDSIKEEEPVKIPEPIKTTEDIVDAKIDISLGYMAFYTYEFKTNGIATYFDMSKFYNINPYGAAVRVEFMKLPSLLGVSGLGLNATWSPMKKTAEHYTLKTNLITASLLFVKKFRLPHSRTMFEFHIGGGGMLFVLPTYTYETGYEPQTYNWIYPEATAGIAFQIYFTRHWGIDFSIDAVYPFLVEVPFPVAQATISSGWHF